MDPTFSIWQKFWLQQILRGVSPGLPCLSHFSLFAINGCGKCSKISNTFLVLFLNKMLLIRAGIQKMLVTIANREEPNQTASFGMGVHCLCFFGRQLVFEILEHLRKYCKNT